MDIAFENLRLVDFHPIFKKNDSCINFKEFLMASYQSKLKGVSREEKMIVYLMKQNHVLNTFMKLIQNHYVLLLF